MLPQTEVFIFTGPVRSGKTTALMHWVTRRGQVGGILMPDVEGTRMLYDISANVLHPFETDAPPEQLVQIGRFRFLKSSFELGNNLIRDAALKPKNMTVIDEIGKLELNNEGFHAALSFALGLPHKRLLLVVRDSLLALVVQKYEIGFARVITCQQLHELN